MTAWLQVGDSYELLRMLPDNSIDSLCSDPPYLLGFMGKQWDKLDGNPAQDPAFWAEVYRVLKPGAYGVAFGAPRTFHRLAVAMEDAGFEIRDSLHWIFGCLSEDTEILVDGEWTHYQSATPGRRALCYDAGHDTYSWQAIEALYVYPYADIAYRIRSDHTDQVVSRNHRCPIERGGRITFEFAETLEREARVPVLEDLPRLLSTVPVWNQGAGDQEPTLRSIMSAENQAPHHAAIKAQGSDHSVPSLRNRGVEAIGMAKADQGASVLVPLQRAASRGRVGEACAQRPRGMGCGCGGIFQGEDEWGGESGLEGRGHLQAPEGQLRFRAACALPGAIREHGAEGRVCSGAQVGGGASAGQMPHFKGSGAPREPQAARQPSHEPGVVRVESGPQALRGSRFTATTLARVEPFWLDGKVWCVKVPTGAFVARRNGKVFVTGNSGFPKSMDISKALDKMAGAEREVVGRSTAGCGNTAGNMHKEEGFAASRESTFNITAPATDAARQWQGFGTALKPAHEPILLVRKPPRGTVASNVLAYGVGGVNVDGCRIDGEAIPMFERVGAAVQGRTHSAMAPGSRRLGTETDQGRWPSNVILTHSPDCGDRCAAMCPVAMLDQIGGESGKSGVAVQRNGGGGQIFGSARRGEPMADSGYTDSGGVSRYFLRARYGSADWLGAMYHGKAQKRERNAGVRGKRSAAELGGRKPDSPGLTHARSGANHSGAANYHPTVKPVEVMRWLARLVTPPGGITLDPFLGSGTTAIAAAMEGLHCVGFDLDPDHIRIARERLEYRFESTANPQADERQVGLFEASA